MGAPRAGSRQGLRLRDEARVGLRVLIAPDSCILECAHALARAERRGLITDASSLWHDVMKTCPRLESCLPLVPRALEMASRVRIGVYDCLYVALAEREGCDLITEDERLANSLGTMFPFLKLLTSFP